MLTQVTDFLEAEVYFDFVQMYPDAALTITSIAENALELSHTYRDLSNMAHILTDKSAVLFGPSNTSESEGISLTVNASNDEGCLREEHVLDVAMGTKLISASSDLVKLLDLILNDDELVGWFRSFLIRIQANCFLDAYYEIKETVLKLQEVFNSDDSDFQMASILYVLHEYYEKYLSSNSSLMSKCHFRDVLLTIVL